MDAEESIYYHVLEHKKSMFRDLRLLVIQYMLRSLRKVS